MKLRAKQQTRPKNNKKHPQRSAKTSQLLMSKLLQLKMTETKISKSYP